MHRVHPRKASKTRPIVEWEMASVCEGHERNAGERADRSRTTFGTLADDRPLFVLSQELHERVKKFESYSYGIKRVTLTLRDGSKLMLRLPGTGTSFSCEGIAR